MVQYDMPSARSFEPGGNDGLESFALGRVDALAAAALFAAVDVLFNRPFGVRDLIALTGQLDHPIAFADLAFGNGDRQGVATTTALMERRDDFGFRPAGDR